MPCTTHSNTRFAPRTTSSLIIARKSTGIRTLTMALFGLGGPVCQTSEPAWTVPGPEREHIIVMQQLLLLWTTPVHLLLWVVCRVEGLRCFQVWLCFLFSSFQDLCLNIMLNCNKHKLILCNFENITQQCQFLFLGKLFEFRAYPVLNLSCWNYNLMTSIWR